MELGDLAYYMGQPLGVITQIYDYSVDILSIHKKGVRSNITYRINKSDITIEPQPIITCPYIPIILKQNRNGANKEWRNDENSS